MEKAMLLIANESSKRTRTLVDVARELSLTLTYFRNTATLAELLDGQSRRIIVLTEPDIAPAIVKRISEAGGKRQFSVIIAGDSKALRSSDKAELVEKLVESANLQWVTPEYNFDQLGAATRGGRSSGAIKAYRSTSASTWHLACYPTNHCPINMKQSSSASVSSVRISPSR